MKKNKIYANRKVLWSVHLLLLASAWLLPASCSQEEVTSSNTGEEVLVKLSLSVADMQGESSTRSSVHQLFVGGGSESSTVSNAVADKAAGNINTTSVVTGTAATRASVTSSYGNVIDENTIQDLWVFQFVGGTFVRKEYLPAGSFNKDYLDVALSKNIDAATSNLYFIANAGPSAFSTPVTTETAFQALSSTIATESNLFPLAGYMPMIGQLTAVSIPSGFAGGTEVKLTRLLARVDVTYTLSETIASLFQLSEAKVCNVSSRSYYYAPAEGTKFPVQAVVTNFSNLTGINGTTGALTFYLPDNRRGSGTNSSGLPSGKGFLEYATYFQLSGFYQGQEIKYNFYLGTDDLNDYNLVRNRQYIYNLTLTGASSADSRVQKVDPSNCYMVKPGESVKISVKRANQSDLGIQLPDLTTGWTAEVIWRDNSVINLTLSETFKSKGFFEVTSTTAGQTGNALVCIKDDSNNILWSWHIWVSYYSPATTNHSYNSLVWMDRNLGADNATPGSVGALGYLYQWGRKDPFAGASATAAGTTTQRTLYSGASGNSTYSVPAPIVAPTTSANNLQNSIRNPALFYFKTSDTYDWYPGSATTQNDALWGATKTVYDPCPQGWKVPANGAWPSTLSTSTGTWDAANLGRTITATSAWYPAAGCRVCNAGALLSVGAYGYFWSSTVVSTLAYNLNFSSSTVHPSYNYNRSSGYGLRCVQE